jgi:hypothetical protein
VEKVGQDELERFSFVLVIAYFRKNGHLADSKKNIESIMVLLPGTSEEVAKSFLREVIRISSDEEVENLR